MSSHSQVDVLTQHNNNARTGANLVETTLTPGNVSTVQFGMLFKRILDDHLIRSRWSSLVIQVNGGTRDIVYVTTVNNSVYAFHDNDADAVLPIWHVNFGTPADVHSADFGCLDINGRMGMIGTPVVDKPVESSMWWRSPAPARQLGRQRGSSKSSTRSTSPRVPTCQRARSSSVRLLSELAGLVHSDQSLRAG